MKNERSKVILIPCDTYEKETIYRSVKAGIDALGGIGSFVSPEEKILVKPNFLSSAKPESAITTHPAVIEAMLRILHEENYPHITYGDSPAFVSSVSVAQKLGLPEIAAAYNAAPAAMDEGAVFEFPEGITAKRFHFAKGVTEADTIINLCKMKTHALERITGAVKNVYGFIHGTKKAAGHVEYPNASKFARMLCDIHRCKKIPLHIMDGVTAMEGNGPRSGDPTPMKVLLLSSDPVALDTVFCHLVHLDPELVPTCVQGEAMGIGFYHKENIEICKLTLPKDTADECLLQEIGIDELQKEFGRSDFNVDRNENQKTNALSGFSRLFTPLMRRPVIKKELCIKCGICVEHCPVPGKAVDFKYGKSSPPVYQYKKCIRCYCCQELCPQTAIVVKGKH